MIRGLSRTGRLVTSAALILFLAFAALGSGPEVIIKIFATGLGAGIIIDATIVRAAARAGARVAVRPLELVAAELPARLLRVRAVRRPRS